LRTLDSIIAASAEALRPLLQEAFEAGRGVGRGEAAADLKAKIVGLLSIADQSATTDTEELIITPDLAAVASNGRAAQGSVKPTIARMIVDGAQAGVTSEEITTRTGFKPNTVRGTLWTLGNEGLAVKRGGRWYPVDGDQLALDRVPEGEAEAVGASASHQPI
jgi:hypothetical protein